MPRRSSALRVLLLALFLAAACSPELNWRELRSEEGGFVAVLPGKPRFEEREISGEPGVVLHFWSSEASGAVFGVGYADYPASRRVPVEQTRDALAGNIRGRIVEDKELAPGSAKGREFRAENADTFLAARLLASGSRLYQIAVVSRKDGIAPTDVELFLDSLRLTPQR
jgi:hypothetical protein